MKKIEGLRAHGDGLAMITEQLEMLGFVTLHTDEEGQVIVTLTDKGKAYVEALQAGDL